MQVCLRCATDQLSARTPDYLAFCLESVFPATLLRHPACAGTELAPNRQGYRSIKLVRSALWLPGLSLPVGAHVRGCQRTNLWLLIKRLVPCICRQVASS